MHLEPALHVTTLAPDSRHVCPVRVYIVRRIERDAVEHVQRGACQVKVEKVHHDEVERYHRVRVAVQILFAPLPEAFFAPEKEVRK